MNPKLILTVLLSTAVIFANDASAKTVKKHVHGHQTVKSSAHVKHASQVHKKKKASKLHAKHKKSKQGVKAGF